MERREARRRRLLLPNLLNTALKLLPALSLSCGKGAAHGRIFQVRQEIALAEGVDAALLLRHQPLAHLFLQVALEPQIHLLRLLLLCRVLQDARLPRVVRRHLDAAERLSHRVLLDEENARKVDAARKALLLEELHADVTRHEDAAI